MANIEEILNKLKQGDEAFVDLVDIHNEEYRLHSALIPGNNLEFQLVFPPNSWEAKNLLSGSTCHITVVRKNSGSVTFKAELLHVVDERRLAFLAKEAVNPEALRDFFRVSINIPIEIGYVPGPKEVKVIPWSLTGSTVDLSGSGVLGLFPDKPLYHKRLYIKIFHNADEDPITCSGDVIRAMRMRKNRFQVALHFNEIERTVRDHIIACCLREQRRQLRENVRLQDQ